MKKVWALLLAVMMMCLMAGCGTEVVLDVTQFSRISKDRLIAIMGEQDDYDEMTILTSNGKARFEIMKYRQDGAEYTFFVQSNKVAALEIRHHDDNRTEYKDGAWKSVFRQYGVTGGSEKPGNPRIIENLGSEIEQASIGITEGDDWKEYIGYICFEYDGTYMH